MDGMPDTAVSMRLRTPRTALIAVFFLVLCVTPLAGVQLALLSLYLIPIALTAWLWRTGTDVDADAVTLHAVFGSRRVPWEDIAGLSVGRRGELSLALTDGRLLALPLARVRHLAVIARVSGGRLSVTPAAR
jgi:hypothetical protein